MEFKVGDRYRWLRNDGRYWLRDDVYEVNSVDNHDIRMSTKDPYETYNIDISLINNLDFWQKVESLENNPTRKGLEKIMETKVKFQIGDIVEYGGVEGTITEINKKCTYPIFSMFGDPKTVYTFTMDGKFDVGHTKPLLSFVRRPKKKVKKTFYSLLTECSEVCVSSMSLGYIFNKEEICREYYQVLIDSEKTRVVSFEIEVEE